MSRLSFIALLAIATPWAAQAWADQTSFAYEADTWPWLSGFLFADSCSAPGSDCADYLEDGHYVTVLTDGDGGGGSYNYHRTITPTGGTPPETLWVEWRFRSSYSYLDSNGFVLDDARVRTQYDQVVVSVSTWMWGDAAFDASVCCSVTGMPMGEFHTYRFEIADGLNSRRWADGVLLMATSACCAGSGGTFIQFGGSGGGLGGGPDGLGYPGLTDEWDYIRYGLITFGEVVIESDPPNGYIDPRQDRPVGMPQMLQGLDRFMVTFNEPNGLHIGNITVESTAPASLRPNVQWVTRPEGDDGDTWEIRLDKRIPPGHRTRFIISDEADAAAVSEVGASSVVEYAFLPGDVNGDETANTQDLLALVQGLNACASGGTCGDAESLLQRDINRSGTVNTQDLLRTVQLLNGTQTLQPWNGVSLPDWP